MKQRPIKFRTWDKNEKCFWEWAARPDVSFSLGNRAQRWESVYQNPYRFDLLQSTGLHDKNGKEIWEGDVVMWGNHAPTKCKVVYSSPSFVLEEVSQEADQSALYDHRDVEVIGNIWENSDLLSPLTLAGTE